MTPDPKIPQESVEDMAAEQGPRWPSRKDAWLDGYREGEQHARMTSTAAISREDHLEALKARRKQVLDEVANKLNDAIDGERELRDRAAENDDREGTLYHGAGFNALATFRRDLASLSEEEPEVEPVAAEGEKPWPAEVFGFRPSADVWPDFTDKLGPPDLLVGTTYETRRYVPAPTGKKPPESSLDHTKTDERSSKEGE